MTIPAEVALPPGTLVVADLHLDVERESDVTSFLDWLAGAAAGAPRVLILGDLFEYWFGPGQIRSPGAAAVVRALARTTAAGTAVDVVPGNRDFLLDRAFEARSGCRVCPAGVVGVVGNERVLFLHGDELCTLDRPYQRLRSILRSAPVRLLARVLPAGWLTALARRLRRRSRQAVDSKAPEVMAQQPEACRRAAEEFGAKGVVCGHAHRWRDERLPGGPRWVVLDAFGGERDVLEVRSDGELVPRSSRRG